MNPQGRKASLLASAALWLAASPAVIAQTLDRHGALDFQGQAIVSVSDADMLASAYVNGQLGPREGQDALSIIALGGDPRDWTAVEVFASNSVAGPPSAVEISPDGRFAFVIETFTPRPDNDDPHTFADLGIGSKLKVFDISDRAAPALVQEVTTLARPDAVRMNAAGSILAVTSNPEGGAGRETPLALYRFADGQLSEAATPAIAGWPLDTGRLIDLDWHPSENVVAMIDEVGNTLRFARIGDDLTVTPFGNVVDVERAPYRVEFTPDGRHVVLNALYWGADIAGFWIEAPRGSVLAVRMNAEGEGDSARHAFVSRIETGVSPEGIAVSPDGRWVATTNLERSYLPYDDARITWFSSITLARLDQATGQLAKVGDFSYDGILPEAAVFDNSGNYLAVVTYDHFDDRRTGGSVDFWRIQADPLDAANVQLVKTEHSVPVARGAHSMQIIR
jgi:DNA-binding beta-propeller fold protein YncE